ncbi:hypothetical protein QWA_17540, partial [Alcaligenes faecalis subsp. faecalis NCIB 8687]
MVACPQCGSTHTRVISQFGSTPLFQILQSLPGIT